MQFKIRTKTVLSGLGLITAMLSAPVSAGDVYVIAHPSVTLSSAELRDMYLGEKQFSGSIKLVPVDNSAVQSDFLAKVLRIEASKYASLWTKKGFRGGLAAPIIKSGDAEVINYVKNTKGAVGYVSTPATGVNQLLKY